MNNQENDRWRELCEAIMREPDSKRLMELVQKLNQILEERENQPKPKGADLREQRSLYSQA
jgi:hypothetical protein